MNNNLRKSIEARITSLASTVSVADALAAAHEACSQPSAAGTVRWSVMPERHRLGILRFQRDLLIEQELDDAMIVA